MSLRLDWLTPSNRKDNEQTIHPARNLLGTLRLPGDKSISHRYALLAAMAEGVSRFHNFSTGADCASSLACMSGNWAPR
jgi:3-phosphoshikimate 1-carboxyvinyltransferase